MNIHGWIELIWTKSTHGSHFEAKPPLVLAVVVVLVASRQFHLLNQHCFVTAVVATTTAATILQIQILLWVDSNERYDAERRAWKTKKCTNSKHLTTSLVLLKICLNNANMAKVSSFVPPLHRFWFKKLIGRTLWYGNDNLASQIKRVYSFVVFRFLDHNFHGHIYFPFHASLYFSVSISGQRKKPTQQGKHWKKDINTLNNLKWSWKCSSRSIGSIFWFMNQSFGVRFTFCLLQMEYCFFFCFIYDKL